MLRPLAYAEQCLVSSSHSTPPLPPMLHSMFSTYILIFINKYIIYILKTMSFSPPPCPQPPLSYLSTFYCPQSSPHPLSQKRERGRGRKGEYIKGKEFVIYILYIYNINIYV